jgi:hypothetical protein
LEQIDLLFSGPKVLIDMSQEELHELENARIQQALDDKAINLKTTGADMVHVEEAGV